MTEILAAFINAGISGAALTFVVWLALSVVSRRSLNAATRYAVWWTTLLVVIALPVFYLPRHTPIPSIHQPIVVEEPVVSINAPAPAAAITPVSSEVTTPSRWPQFPFSFHAGPWPERVFAAWALIAAFMLVRLGVSYAILEQRKRRARPAKHLEAWPVRALISPDIASPMAAGLFRPAILLPERLISELDQEELDQIRVHETAHLLRRDDIALLIQRLVEALFALQPVVRWITRRIDLEREIACDDFVIEQTGKARPYASCLTRVVEIAGGMRSSLAASAATEERSHLARRIEMLLDKTRHRGTSLLKLRLLAIVAALAGLSFLAVKAPGIVAFAAEQDSWFDQSPVPPEPPASPSVPGLLDSPAPPEPPAIPAPSPSVPEAPEPPAPPAPQSSSMESHNSRTITSRWSDGLHSRELRVRGDVQFTDDETDVQTMGPDAYFSYEEAYGFTSRKYQATADGSGQIKRQYLVDGHEKPLDADGKAWLRAAIPDLLRESGIDAPARVRRILKQSGAPGVLTEIAKIHSDGTKKIYIRELVPLGNLNAEQYQSLLRIVRGMNSDGEKAGVLVFLGPYTLKDNLRDFTFEAVKTIHSDGEKHRVLTQFILHDSSRATHTQSARAAGDINSDGERAAVLIDLAPNLRSNDDLRRPFFRSTETIHSDGEKARVLMAVIGGAGDQPDVLAEALHVAASINSDGEKARVLVHADGYWKDDARMSGVYFETARGIHSDGEKARVLTSLVGRSGISDRTLMALVKCAEGINSDGEKARVLVAVANHSVGKPEVRETIKNAAGSIHSDGEYRRVMTAIDLRASNRP